MCGINGIIGPHMDDLALMVEKTTHRGPDDTRTVSFPRISLGHNRLSIVDLTDTGAQPMTTRSGRFTIVFNGEIYNAEELRHDLELKGVTFRGKSDTEVLLYAYETWGESCTNRLRGMWAFAIYDTDNKTLFLSRDPFGIKPLYVYKNEHTFLFSSEIRGLLAHHDAPRHINDEGIRDMLFQGYITAPTTIISGVRALVPGECLTIHIDTLEEKHRIMHLDAPTTDEPRDEDLLDVLRDSVRHHLISDVPVGLFFSGGIDSTVIALLLKELDVSMKAFHITVPGRHDTEYAEHIAHMAHIDLHTQTLSPDMIPSRIDDVIQKMDEPLGDSSFLPTLAVAHLASQHVKVVLSGEGGDELFGGYPRARRLAGLAADIRLSRASRYYSLIMRHLFPVSPSHFPLREMRGLLRRLETIRGDTLGLFLTETAPAAGLMNTSSLRARITKRVQERELTDRGLAFDRLILLPDELLLKADTATMAYSLEGRVPFLDRSVIKYVGGAPASWKRAKGVGKAPLRRFLKKHLPDNVIDRPKAGFSSPVSSLLYTHKRESLLDALRWYRSSYTGLVPTIDATITHALTRNQLKKMLSVVGYSYYSIFVLYHFIKMNKLSG